MKNVLEYPEKGKVAVGLQKILRNMRLDQIVLKNENKLESSENEVSINLINEIDKIMKFKK